MSAAHPSEFSLHAVRDGKRFRTRLQLTGVVQGVGFRPFVYKLAKQHSLAGFVVNTSSGVVDLQLDSRPEDETRQFVGSRIERDGSHITH